MGSNNDIMIIRTKVFIRLFIAERGLFVRKSQKVSLRINDINVHFCTPKRSQVGNFLTFEKCRNSLNSP